MNAITQSGTLKIRTKVRDSNQGGTVLIEIEESGVGILEGEIKAIFDPFYTSKAEG